MHLLIGTHSLPVCSSVSPLASPSSGDAGCLSLSFSSSHCCSFIYMVCETSLFFTIFIPSHIDVVCVCDCCYLHLVDLLAVQVLLSVEQLLLDGLFFRAQQLVFLLVGLVRAPLLQLRLYGRTVGLVRSAFAAVFAAAVCVGDRQGRSVWGQL